MGYFLGFDTDATEQGLIDRDCVVSKLLSFAPISFQTEDRDPCNQIYIEIGNEVPNSFIINEITFVPMAGNDGFEVEEGDGILVVKCEYYESSQTVTITFYN